MTEDFLHYLWRYKAFDTKRMRTLAGEQLDILFAGVYNTGGGPDFLNARLRIGNTLWVGHVEIHIKSSDWNRHQHQLDEHYKNVILHVVLFNDTPISLYHEGDLPVFSLYERFESSMWKTYQRWLTSTSREIICDLQAYDFDELNWMAWKDRLLVERLERKCEWVWKILDEVGGYWPEVLYRCLAVNFGFHRNSEAFDLLAHSVPFKLLKRYRLELDLIEALLFGQAGFLENTQVGEDEYIDQLYLNYRHLAAKHQLQPMNAQAWTFGGVRPSNFPTIRIAQFAMLVHSSENLLANLLEIEDLDDYKRLLKVQVSAYWHTHFRIGVVSKKQSEHVVSQSFMENMMINTIAVVLFAFGRFNQQDRLIQQGFRIFEHCKPEDNSITQKWVGRGPLNKSSADSQALIQLFNHYCSNKKCLDCAIGHQQLKEVKQHDTSYS